MELNLDSRSALGLVPGLSSNEVSDLMRQVHNNLTTSGDPPREDDSNRVRLIGAFSTLFVEAARHEIVDLSDLLGDVGITDENRIRTIKDEYHSLRPLLTKELLQIGHRFAHIVDVKWRLCHEVSNTLQGKTGEPAYDIELITQKAGQSESIKFRCSLEELQDLVSRLKTAEKCNENYAKTDKL